MWVIYLWEREYILISLAIIIFDKGGFEREEG